MNREAAHFPVAAEDEVRFEATDAEKATVNLIAMTANHTKIIKMKKIALLGRGLEL